MSRRNLAQRRSLPGIGPRRAEIIIAGAMVFAELMHLCNLRSFRYLPLGLRDGLLAQMMADYNASTAMKEQVESERHDALLSAAKHYGADLPFAQRIRDLTLELFRRLQSVHQLPPEYADWLEAAAMLHEVGAYINRSGRRRHTYYVISNSEIFGYTPLQRRIIAAIARFVGKSLPSPSNRVMRVSAGHRADSCGQSHRAAAPGARAGSGPPCRRRPADSPHSPGRPRSANAEAESRPKELIWNCGPSSRRKTTSRPSSAANCWPKPAESSAPLSAACTTSGQPALRPSFSTRAIEPFFSSTECGEQPPISLFRNSVIVGLCPTTMIASLRL